MLRQAIMFAVGSLLLQPDIASAQLGSNLASVQADSAALRGSIQTVTGAHYAVHEIQTDTQIKVREYVRSDGIVFALGWSGPVLPDLQALLGPYFAAYSNAVATLAHPGLHRSLHIETGELVLESSGHLRAFAGRAYLPALLPAAVSVSELR